MCSVSMNMSHEEMVDDLEPQSLTKLLLSIQEQVKQTNTKLDLMDTNILEIKRDNNTLKTELKLFKKIRKFTG